MNRKIAIASAAAVGIAAISLTACGPAHKSTHHVTIGNTGATGGAVPAADCGISVTAKSITAYLDFHGTADGLTAGSQCAELVKEASKQHHVAVAQVTDIPSSYKSVCSASSKKGYTVTVYSKNALSDAAGKQFCKEFSA